MVTDTLDRVCEIHRVLAQVPDPEIPVLSVIDLGIVRSASTDRVLITTTYTGCPASEVIEREIRRALDCAGFENIRIERSLSPAWSTNWITPAGRAKLEKYGIAPPSKSAVRCPQCHSDDVVEVSRFGSTPCKAM